MHTTLLDTEKGHQSVSHLIDKGLVTLVDASSFQKLDDYVWKIVRNEVKTELVVLDTISFLATRTRQDVVADPKTMDGAMLWDKRFSLGAQQKDWGIMGDLILRLVMRLQSSEIPTILLSHEAEKEDPSTGIDKMGPALSPSLRGDIIAVSDVVARYYRAQQAFEVDGKKYDRWSRVLRLEESDNALAKARNPDTERLVIPPIIPSSDADPLTLGKLRSVFGGKLPLVTTIYGPPGIGKTTLACSLANESKEIEKHK